jgi:hypothetical protein
MKTAGRVLDLLLALLVLAMLIHAGQVYVKMIAFIREAVLR